MGKIHGKFIHPKVGEGELMMEESCFQFPVSLEFMQSHGNREDHGSAQIL